MININAKVKDRYQKGLKKFQPILKKALAADVNESDTVTIITDILCDVFGYDKYENITSEFAIKKTFCDIAIKLNDNIPLLMECKAIGIELKEEHVRQATNYAADSGIEWVVLTNGVTWKVFKILFTKPVEKQLVYEFNFCDLSVKKQSDLEMLYYLSIESFSKTSKATLDDFYAQKLIVNRHIVGQILMTDTMVTHLKKYLHKLYPEVKTTDEELLTVIKTEIFKREIIEGDSAVDASKKIKKAEKAVATAKAKKSADK